MPPLTKHQSLGSSSNTQYKWITSQSFHSAGEVKSPELFIGPNNCNRELSPVRWCDREVDGVYLGKSGWVQVQQRSLDENKQTNLINNISLASSLLTTKRTPVKLSDYHFNSEPSKYSNDRPSYLSFHSGDIDSKTIPSPPLVEQESFSPPSVTPIISPPPAFQDTKKSPVKSRTFFGGKTPFLPRSNAIEDSDASPPITPPPLKWKPAPPINPQFRRPKLAPAHPINDRPPRTIIRMPQTKSLEDTTANRRSQFLQHYRGSSSSSSSSMGFRSLDSTFNRPGNIMPRLSENTDSSIDHYQDADDEDNNSSSVNISMIPITPFDSNRSKEKVSPSGRSRFLHHRVQSRRSPAGSDTNKPANCTSPSSSSSSSNEFLSRSPPGPAAQQIRRSAPNKPYQTIKSPSQEDSSLQRVRRSRSLQLPEKKLPSTQTKLSPQHPDIHKVVVKVGSTPEKPKRYGVNKNKPQMSLEGDLFEDEDMLREAEVVTGYLYGNRSRAAAQALLMHRYHNNDISRDEKNKEVNKPVNNGVTVYYIGNSRKDKPKTLLRGSTSPSFSGSRQNYEMNKTDIKNPPCSRDNCDFWPHCAHRDNISREPNFVMRSSQSYPTHARSLDSNVESDRFIPSEKKQQEHFNKLRLAHEIERQKQSTNKKRLSPNKQSIKRDQPEGLKKSSPVNPKSRTPPFGTVSGSSSGSDVWLTASGKSNVKSSGASTPLEDISGSILLSVTDDKSREMILTRPGSAPFEDKSNLENLIDQQRSMSLPKSFLSASYQQW